MIHHSLFLFQDDHLCQPGSQRRGAVELNFRKKPTFVVISHPGFQFVTATQSRLFWMINTPLPVMSGQYIGLAHVSPLGIALQGFKAVLP